MKSERRHELKENELADWLEKAIEAVTPHVKTIIGVVAGAVVLFLAYALWQNRVAASQQAAWDGFYAAAASVNAEADMLKLADAHPAAPAGLWARLFVADSQLAEGTQYLFTNRAAAKPKLKEAVVNYRAVIENAKGKYEPLVERALYGEAKGYEALGEKSDLDQATKLYQQIAEQFPEGALAADCKTRIEALKKPTTKEFYDWFVTATPLTPATSGIPGPSPGFDASNVPAPPAENTTVDPGFEPFQDAGPATPPTTTPAESGVPAESGTE